MSARKLWATKWTQIPGATHVKFPSKVAVYRHLDRMRETWSKGHLRSQHVAVYVDERDGRGWQLYERIDLDNPVGGAS